MACPGSSDQHEAVAEAMKFLQPFDHSTGVWGYQVDKRSHGGWLGIKDTAEENVWKSCEGRATDDSVYDFTKWSPGEPAVIDRATDGDADCSFIHFGSGEWDARDCDGYGGHPVCSRMH